MKKTMMIAALLVTLLFWSNGTAFAEAVEVAGDKIFVADGGVSVLNLLDGSPATCSEETLAALTDVSGATDVEIVGDKAVVTTAIGEGEASRS